MSVSNKMDIFEVKLAHTDSFDHSRTVYLLRTNDPILSPKTAGRWRPR